MEEDKAEATGVERKVPGRDIYKEFNEEIYDCIMGVSHLLLTARLQAREADIRARYAKQFADRSVAEAKSAHQVSEALAKTARAIASMALEFSNKPESAFYSECHLDMDHPLESGSRFIDHNTSEKENVSPTSRKTPQKLSPTEKYSTVFPADLSPQNKEMPDVKSPTLEPLWETGSAVEKNGETGSAGEKNGDCVENDVTIGDDRRRTMQIYKDSKLHKSFETGDAHYEAAAYSNMAMQPSDLNTVE